MMVSRARNALVTLIATVALALSCATDWEEPGMRAHEAVSQHFRVISFLGYRDAKDAAKSLERRHAAIVEASGLAMPSHLPPLDVFLLTRSLYEDYRPTQWAGGYFMEHADGDVIVTPTPAYALGHEYIHYHQRATGRSWYPFWYSEGMATFLGDARAGAKTLEVGGGSGSPGLFWTEDEARALRVPLETLLDVHSGHLEELSSSDVRVVYKLTYLLFHFLKLNYMTGEANRGARAEDFARLVYEGRDKDEASQECFGVTLIELEAEFVAYLSRDRLPRGRLKFPRSEKSSVRVTTMSEGETLFALAMLSMKTGNRHDALIYCDSVFSFNPQHARARACLARLKAGPDAQEVFEEALALAPNDSVVHLWYGLHLSKAPLTNEETPPEQPPTESELELARLHFEHSASADPNRTAAHAALAQVHLAIGQEPEAGLGAIDRALELRPWDPRLQLVRAALLLRLDRQDEAGEQLARAKRTPHRASHSSEVEELIRQLEGELADGDGADEYPLRGDADLTKGQAPEAE